MLLRCDCVEDVGGSCADKIPPCEARGVETWELLPGYFNIINIPTTHRQHVVGQYHLLFRIIVADTRSTRHLYP